MMAIRSSCAARIICALQGPILARVLDTVPGPERGLRSGVSAPVIIDEEVVGVFGLFSRRSKAYSQQDLALAERLAAYVAVGLAHQRLADAARRAAVERERAANVESSVELLRTISGVLDIRTVFPQVSAIANKVLPHDLLTMMFHSSGQVLIEVTSSDEFPEIARLVKTDDSRPKDGYILIDDFTTATLSIVEPADVRERIVAAGYRSLLAVIDRARATRKWASGSGRSGRVRSGRPTCRSPAASPITSRWPCRTSSSPRPRGRWPRRTLAPSGSNRACSRSSDELESKTGHARVVGQSPEWHDMLKKATQVAATETTVLLTRRIGHRQGSRRALHPSRVAREAADRSSR